MTDKAEYMDEKNGISRWETDCNPRLEKDGMPVKRHELSSKTDDSSELEGNSAWTPELEGSSLRQPRVLELWRTFTASNVKN